MVDIKEIKHIKTAPFTLMTSAIHAVLAFIVAIILLLSLGVLAAIPELSAISGVLLTLGVALVILIPVTSFLYNIVGAFVIALLYNVLTPKVGGIKLGMEGEEVKSIPVVSYALILACISAILTFILGLYVGLAGTPVLTLLSIIIPQVTDATGSFMAMFGGIWAVFWIILMPILVFIFSFIGMALFALFYNVLIPKIGGIKLIFGEAGKAFELTNIPAVPAALALAVVQAVFGLLQGILYMIQYSMLGNVVGGLVVLIVQIISSFIITFIFIVLAAIIYNFLQPKIGGVKLELE
ncbi:MAG: hypothetical protein PHQ17_00755 [Methanobacterium sp.]|jgi:hypothetical protein|nr:hypothetical protein [Methanobacterium sp.]